MEEISEEVKETSTYTSNTLQKNMKLEKDI